MPATFRNATHAGENRPQTIEEAFRFHCAFAGLHKFDFPLFYDGFDDGWDTSDLPEYWEVTEEGVLNGEDVTTIWRSDATVNPVPDEFILEYDYVGTESGVAFWKFGGDNAYGFYFSGDDIRMVLWKDLRTYVDFDTVLIKNNVSGLSSNGHHVKIIATSNRFETFGSPVGFISLYIDDKHILTYAEPNIPDIENTIHFIAYNSEIAFSNLKVPRLSEKVPWQTIDIGAASGTDLQRILEGRGLRWMIRYDGTVKVWKAMATDPVLTLSEEAVLAWEEVRDWREATSHDRVVGGFYETDTYDSDLYNAFGHRFTYDNNPSIESLEDTFDAGERNMRNKKETFRRAQCLIHANPLLEQHDHIAIEDHGDWIIDDISYGIALGQLTMQLQLRSYIDAS